MKILNRLTRAIRDALVVLVVSTMSLVGLLWSLSELTNKHPYVFVIGFIVLAFSVLVKVCYDYEVDK